MKGIIYIIRNSVNKKVYVGQTTQTLKKRISNYRQDCKTRNYGIYAAMDKYGFENFSFEVLGTYLLSELDKMERFFISEFNCRNRKKGYNIQIGGNDIKQLPAWRKKQMSDNHYSKKPGFIAPNAGKVFSEEWKNNMRKPKNLSPAQLKKNKKVAREANLGRKFSQEWKNNIAESRKKPILQYTTNNVFVKEWPSLEDAVDSLKTSAANISAVLHGRQNTAKGFIWKIK